MAVAGVVRMENRNEIVPVCIDLCVTTRDGGATDFGVSVHTYIMIDARVD